MAESIDEIKHSIETELQEFNRIFDSAFTSQDRLLGSALAHLSHRKGKQIRPVIVLLAGMLCGEVNAKTYHAAASLEMLHTASLVHDDVVDNTFSRRRQPSLNAMFDNKTSVLVGDYMLTKAMGFMARTGDMRLIESLTRLCEEITRGEILQIQHAYALPTEEEYIEVIRKKTAVLFSTCGEIAAIAAGADSQQRDAVRIFCDCLGICFQIKDDIFDYTPKADIGKPTFNDIREGKITLPLLYSLRSTGEKEREEILSRISKASDDPTLPETMYELICRMGGMEYAHKRIEQYRTQAIAQLGIFPDCEAKEALVSTLDYVIDRNV
ncbi:MAG: polyprenyl synthetase family protein [bacterium]|uniref:Polyprenyl synthetase family protein n=1 Tax=Candidatus Aphodosoma intestinipullorum TaxID=2840674 RepID=A0A940DJQ6_9BACT|nr:polyprenyl synthetase family protein [Candidatus Aphodosoma intestinipullorum]